MTDEEYVFHQDVREKKAAGRGIYHKKGGSRSKYCSLPSDNLSEVEKKRRNGELKTYNITRIITSYNDFKHYPEDLMKKYIIGCRDNFGAQVPAIARSMNVTPKTLTQFLFRKKIKIGRGGRYKVSDEWAKFVNGEIDINGKDLSTSENKTEPEPVEVHVSEPDKSLEEPIRITDDDIPLGASIGAIIEALKGSGAKLTIELTL